MIEKLTDDRNKARRGLESETTETLTSQIELEKLAEEFKRAHSDRQGMILICRKIVFQLRAISYGPVTLVNSRHLSFRRM